MKKTLFSIIISLLVIEAIAQNAKVIDSPSGIVISNSGGTDIPYSASILDIRSSTRGVLLPRMSTGNRDAIGSPQAGLLLYNSTTNQFNYHDGAAWQQAFFGNQWSVTGAKYYYNGGNVGIGVADPLYKLDVGGTFHTTNNGYIDGSLSVGGNAIAPIYKIQVNDGSLAIYNTVDDKFWALTYNSVSNYLHLNEELVPRVYFQNGGYVGIGLNPQYPLDVAGTIHTSGNLRADGNAIVDGTATIVGAAYVNNNKGVAFNASGSTNLKIFPFTTATFHAILGGHDLSAEGAIIFGGGFTQAPRVIVGDIDVTGGTSGELYRVQLVLYGCSTNLNGSGNTGCKARLLNTSPNAVNYTITWNCVAIGY